MKRCHICNEADDVSVWEHPVSGEKITFCSYCRQTIIGVCSECSSILSRLDPVGINREGQRICYKCSAAHDLAEDDV